MDFALEHNLEGLESKERKMKKQLLQQPAYIPGTIDIDWFRDRSDDLGGEFLENLFTNLGELECIEITDDLRVWNGYGWLSQETIDHICDLIDW